MRNKRRRNLAYRSMEVNAIVTDCLSLNILESPSVGSDVIASIPALTKVIVDMAESTDSYYKICTAAGIQGFSPKKYIAICNGG